jgi:flavorubredoxin
MKPREIRPGVLFLGAQDWNRRLFDSLIPLPDGTSYNSYLVRGTDKTALIDSVDPAMEHVLADQLADVEKIDYIVSQHTEQDHSGMIPTLLTLFPEATVVCSIKAKSMLMDHLHIPEEKIMTVKEGDTLELGGKTLRFIDTPWVHWPETMSTYLPEDRILFTCDFLGSHIATSEMYAGEDPLVIEAAKRYYAEIMMPFRPMVKNNLKKIRELDFDLVAPSHGPMHDHPELIISAYEKWVADKPENLVVIPYVSMHESTQLMVEHLTSALVERGVGVKVFELTSTDIGELAMSLVDAATIVVGTPTVLVGAHPMAAYAAFLANALRPKTKFAAIIGSYGWGTKVIEQISSLIPNLKVDILETILCKGKPGEKEYAGLDALADKIREKHANL